MGLCVVMCRGVQAPAPRNWCYSLSFLVGLLGTELGFSTSGTLNRGSISSVSSFYFNIFAFNGENGGSNRVVEVH